MFRDRDLVLPHEPVQRARYWDPDIPHRELAPHERALLQDLEVETLLRVMGGGDEFLHGVAREALLGGRAVDAETILYRQEVLRDCLEHPGVVEQLYALVVETLETRRQGHLGVLSRYPAGVLHGSVTLMGVLVEMLLRLRRIAEENTGSFRSEGFSTLFTMLQREIGDDYLAEIQQHLAALRHDNGILLSASLGPGNQGTGYVLREHRPAQRSWLGRLLGRRGPGFTFFIADRDEAGARALGALRDQGINLVANALAQSTEHITKLFAQLRAELGFYLGCLRLHRRLAALGVPLCFPRPQAAGSRRLSFSDLCDPSLALTLGRRGVGNTTDATGKSLLVITGANQGGKSSHLRAIGLAQLMMQAGMFVAAGSFEGELETGLLTHFQREEDAAMKSGKLDEELARMSALVDVAAPESIVLLNESFSSTNECEASEIARQVVRALIERRIKVVFVTHLFEFARLLREEARADTMFLRAERLPDGTRTFRIVEGEPLQTSYGEDLYREVFGAEPSPPAAG